MQVTELPPAEIAEDSRQAEARRREVRAQAGDATLRELTAEIAKVRGK